MSQSSRLWGAALAALILALVAVGCGGDPYQEALKERDRWTVTLRDWVGSEDGLVLTTRLVGPPNAGIETLTVAIDLIGADGEPLERVWHTFDLAEVPRGGPKDINLRLPAPASGTVEGVAIDPLRIPTPEEAGRIEELRGLAGAAG